MPTRLLRDWTDSFAVDCLDVNAERFFVRLIMVVDDFGRFHADPRMLRSKCFPLKTDVRDTDISRWIAACEKAGLIRCYQDPKGRALLEIQSFKQRARTESRYPSPDECPSNDRHLTALGGDEGGDEGVFGDEDEGDPPIAPKGAERAKVLPDRWRNIPRQDRKNHRVLCNNRLMERIGGWFGRKTQTLWTLAEGIALSEIKPPAEDVDLLEVYYMAPDVGDRDIRRRDLLTLLNNWNGELDRARIWKSENQ